MWDISFPVSVHTHMPEAFWTSSWPSMDKQGLFQRKSKTQLHTETLSLTHTPVLLAQDAEVCFLVVFRDGVWEQNTHRSHIPFRTQKHLPQRIYCQDGWNRSTEPLSRSAHLALLCAKFKPNH